MPHINYKRGETREFVFRREHGHTTHDSYSKGKRESWKPWKQLYNQIWRARLSQALRDVEDPHPRRANSSLKWNLS